MFQSKIAILGEFAISRLDQPSQTRQGYVETIETLD